MVGSKLEAVVAAMAALPDDAGGVPDAVLASRMRDLVRLRAMVDAALAEQLAVFDARAGARYDGQSSTQAWLRSGLRLGRDAGDLLRTARQLAGLPLAGKALAAGEITLEHAGVIATLAARVGAAAVAGYEPILVDLARQAPPVKLRVACEQLRQLLDPDGDADEAARQRRARYLSAGRTVDGMVHLQGLLDAACGDVVLTALRAAMPAPAEYEERTAEQRRADALVDVCAGWLAAGQAPTTGGVRPQVQVAVSLPTLRAGSRLPAPDAAQLGDVPVLAGQTPVTAGQARRLACDAGVIPVVLGSQGDVLDIGRQSRVVPIGLRRVEPA